jgi:squalene-associated FAD-dependent desaturase
VIGAGWAGCAAAVTLAQAGVAVTVFETAAVAGGRARRVMRADLPLDNGQHVLAGAYTEALRLLDVVHGDRAEHGRIARMPLAIEPIERKVGRLRLRACRLPAPFGLAAGILTARGLALGDRAGIVTWWRALARAGFRCAPQATVDELLRTCPPNVARELWAPLCLAALNTPIERACAQTFCNVLRATFATGTSASDLLLPIADLSTLFPEAAIRYVQQRGGEVRLRTRARAASVATDGVVVRTAAGDERFDACIVAVGPHQLGQALAPISEFDDVQERAASLAYEPIATVWLGYAAALSLPAPIVRLDDAPGQWLFDRNDVLRRAPNANTRALVAAVISASGPHDRLEPAELARACDAQLRTLVPSWPALAWSQTIVERRATYACVPRRALPRSALPHPRVALAGDWVDGELPATLEAAVRSGVRAADALRGSTAASGQAASQDQNPVPSFAR